MESKNILSPTDQDFFWSRIEPDVRELLKLFESNEQWIVRYEEMPEEFKKVSELLPDIVALDQTPETQSLMKKMIYIIGNMPFRQSVSAISWMNFMSDEDSAYGWGTMLHFQCMMILNETDENDEIKSLSSIICERIKIVVILNIHSDLFINPDMAIFTDII